MVQARGAWWGRSGPGPRALTAALAAALGLAGCGGDEPDPTLRGRWANLSVEVAFDAREVLVSPWEIVATPCPDLAAGEVIRVNGVTAAQDRAGGETCSELAGCYCLEASWIASAVPLDRGRLTVELDSAIMAGTIEVPWPAEHRLWTDDDLVAAMELREEFELRWTPEDVRPPDLELWTETHLVVDTTAEMRDSGPGWARYVFSGPTPDEPWHLSGNSLLERVPPTCPLEGSCVVRSQAHLIAP